MDIVKLREYCLSKKGAIEEFPFGEDVLVFKVGGKIFALTGLYSDLSVSLKCDPEKALELRERYPSVSPGYHLNKTHWNTIVIDGSVADKLILSWIDHSYDLVVRSLTRNIRQKMDL